MTTSRLFVAFALAGCLSPRPEAPARPHIILVMADDQGWGDVGYNGHPLLQTPELDRAAASGLRLDRFYAAAPVCSPTRASVLTGRNPNRIAVFKWGHSIRPQERTLAEALRDAGYATGHFGKWHLGSVRRGSPDSPGANGFDEWLSAPNFYDNDPILSRRGEAQPQQGESSQVAVDAALQWIEAQLAQDAPIFAVVWFGSPHVPHEALERDRALYPDQTEALQNFYGELSGLDRAFGNLRRGLDQLGMRESTLLWYCSDNGALPRVGQTGGARGVKGSVYDGGLLVPSFIEWPAVIRAPRRSDARLTTSDIAPTLCELTGAQLDPERALDGVSLASFVRGAVAPELGRGFWDRPGGGVARHAGKLMQALFDAQQAGDDLAPPERSMRAAQLPDPPYPADRFPGHSAWIADDWKLHRIESDEGMRYELYDLAADPGEQVDLAASQPERVAELRLALEAWLASVVRSLNTGDV